ncbi:MAG: hypothetical protein KKH75_02840 [Actinobacteria bacterium]|nr:hypothetical protein [Actinomycetota bacterium]
MSTDKRQRVEKVPGARRAKLTPAPGTSAEPTPADDATRGDAARDAAARSAAARDTAAQDAAASGAAGASAPRKPDVGPNDARLRQDVPPHY